MRSILDEAKKHAAFREVWVGYLLGIVYLIFAVKVTAESTPDINERWNIIHQNIYTYGATLSALLVVIGISRLMCYEKERKTDTLIYTSMRGKKTAFLSKLGFVAVYCAVVVAIIGAVSLIVHGADFGFKGAFSPIAYCRYFSEEGLPPMPNIAYCIVQYVLLYLSVLYFAGFVMIVAAITKRTALTIFISGGTYITLMTYYYMGSSWFRGAADDIFTEILRFSFVGFMQQETYSWGETFGLGGEWSNVWKPILLVFAIILCECIILWMLWRRKERK